MKNTVPDKILLKDNLKINEPLSENDALKKLKSISKKIKFLGILLEWDIIIPLLQTFFKKYFRKSRLVYFLYSLSA